MSRAPGGDGGARPARRSLRARLDPVAARDTWRAFAASRLVVLLATSFGAILFTKAEAGNAASPSYTQPFDSWPLGGLLDFLLAPLVRWDAQWYLNIAETGYDQAGQADLGARPAFFPVYPLLIHVLGGFTGHAGAVLAGIAISFAAFLGALYVVHRLIALELGADTARTAVWLLAFSPVAFFFSAVYTESLFLLLSAGSLYAARTGRWALAGVLAGIASGTRPTGALLVVPLALLYLLDDSPRGESLRARMRGWRERLRRPRPGILWLALTPAGLAAFSVYLEAVRGNWLQWKDAQYLHGRVETLDPVSALRRAGGALQRAIEGDVADELQFPIMLESLYLAIAVVAIVGVFRLMHVAYGAWCLAVLVPPVLNPVETEPLTSYPRFMLTLFPLYAWLAHFAARRGWEHGLLVGSAAGLTVLSAAFAAWAHLI